MFSSSKATNLFPQISPCFQPSSSSSSSPIFGLNATEFFLHHHQDLVSGHHLAANAAIVEPPNSTFDFPVSNKITTFENLNAFQGKHRMKKDRHSKILTSQGLRDRRVRLSITIARKFFDLQEMLGFDKPSKTLDWLLTNSKTAIEELQFKINRGGVSETSNEDGDRNGGGLFSCSNREAAMYVMRESRAKARARARERTREKMSTKLLNEAEKIQPWNQIATDLNSNCNSSPNAAENWDFSSQSNLCAILDQPKFTKPTSNM